MISLNQMKTHYSETEAAEVLGVSVVELRALIRKYIAQSDDDLPAAPLVSLQPSDLLLLKLLSTQDLTEALQRAAVP